MTTGFELLGAPGTPGLVARLVEAGGEPGAPGLVTRLVKAGGIITEVLLRQIEELLTFPLDVDLEAVLMLEGFGRVVDEIREPVLMVEGLGAVVDATWELMLDPWATGQIVVVR